MATETKSNCCNAPVKSSCADEGTCCYVCEACNEACDVKAENWEDELKQIIYQNCKIGLMCEELEDGQIIGLRTGQGLELDLLAKCLEDFIREKIQEAYDRGAEEATHACNKALEKIKK